MKKIIALIIVFLIIELEGLLAVTLQPVDSLGIKSVNGKNFIEYKVAEHEGWYGIARKYDITYKDLRAANKELGDTLHIGQVVLVPAEHEKLNDPVTKKNSLQNKEKLEPVYYVVKQKETLFAIAKKNKATTEELKKWNHLSTGSLKKGERLIVGYRKTNENPVKVNPEKKEMVGDARKSHVKQDSTAATKVSHENESIVDSLSVTNKLHTPMGRKEVSEQGMATWIDDENINPNKYFALHRTAPIGSIIKVTNRMNKRSIFVKVVGKLPDTGDNDNIIIKISKASAEKMGVRDQRFQCDLSYGVTEK